MNDDTTNPTPLPPETFEAVRDIRIRMACQFGLTGETEREVFRQLAAAYPNYSVFWDEGDNNPDDKAAYLWNGNVMIKVPACGGS
jgi:hypothetical protein